MTAAAVDYLPQNAESEAQLYFKKGLNWSGLRSDQWLGQYLTDQRQMSVVAAGSGAPINVAGSPGLPGAMTGATAASSYHWTYGGQYTAFPTACRALKKSYIAARFSISAVSANSQCSFHLIQVTTVAAMGYLGYLGSISVGNFMICDASGTNKVNGPANDALEHVHELYLNPNASVANYIVDGVSYGGNASCFINTAGNDIGIRWRADNGADAVDRRILPRWVAWGTDGR